jgi:hypothetical protein
VSAGGGKEGEEMTVKEIVAAWLKEHGYDGLRNRSCGCGVNDLFLCSKVGVDDCEPAYSHRSPCNDCDDPMGGCVHNSDFDWVEGVFFCEHKRKEDSGHA